MQTQGIEGYCSQRTVMVCGGLGLSRSRKYAYRGRAEKSVLNIVIHRSDHQGDYEESNYRQDGD